MRSGSCFIYGFVIQAIKDFTSDQRFHFWEIFLHEHNCNYDSYRFNHDFVFIPFLFFLENQRPVLHNHAKFSYMSFLFVLKFYSTSYNMKSSTEAFTLRRSGKRLLQNLVKLTWKQPYWILVFVIFSKRDVDMGVVQWILRAFSDQSYYRTPVNDCSASAITPEPINH